MVLTARPTRNEIRGHEIRGQVFKIRGQVLNLDVSGFVGFSTEIIGVKSWEIIGVKSCTLIFRNERSGSRTLSRSRGKRDNKKRTSRRA